jgi:hypothetical protein
VARLRDVTKRRAAALAAVLLLAGCGALREPVPLLAGPPQPFSGCFTFAISGELIADPTYGTVMRDTATYDETVTQVTRPPTVPVAWRTGFTARRLGSEVEVVDPQGTVVATTGRRYLLPGGYISAGGSSGIDGPGLTNCVFRACGDV